ncbi:urease accessory protein UreF [Geomicrobium sediminis]|uniref:Urease accessory protein UreF n=1 Tax=Geomicrobium sediminis TaxID=1347788 RepID=A0ABS2PI66_9BACL|nr:urease accessory protein UreF [Geomicrobium sediminis]MBM7634720.1 urease accessory protein [Geomicrobium sediminis]
MSENHNDLTPHSNTEATTTNGQMLQLLHILDSAFPIGGYTHSFGMETFIQDEAITNEHELVEYLSSYLTNSVATGDALFVQEAYQRASQSELEQLIELDHRCHAFKITEEARKGSAMMGRQFIKTVTPLLEDAQFVTFRERLKQKQIDGHYPVVFGMYTSLLGVSVDVAVSTFLYSSMNSLITNAVRAIPLGQQAGVRTVHAMFPLISELTKTIQGQTIEDIANNALLIDISSMNHQFLRSRLFIS